MLYRCINHQQPIWSHVPNDQPLIDLIKRGEVVLYIQDWKDTKHVLILHEGRIGLVERRCLKHIDDWTPDAL